MTRRLDRRRHTWRRCCGDDVRRYRDAGRAPPQAQGAAVRPPRRSRKGGRARRARRRAAARAQARARVGGTRNGQAQHESVGHALAIIERLGYESGSGTRSSAPTRTSFRTRRRRPTDGRQRWPESRQRRRDLLHGPSRDSARERRRSEELLPFVRDGKGFVAAHVGLTAFESWPEFREMIGARFDRHPITGAGHDHQRGVRIFRQPSASVRIPVNDEFYQPKDLSRDKVDVRPSARSDRRAGQSPACT